jgi:hypothetical protein
MKQWKIFPTLCFDPFKPKLVYIIFNNSVRNLKRTLPVTITNINLLTLLKEIIHVYTEKLTDPINTKCRVTDR